MNDAFKAGGIIAGGGVGIAVVMLAVRIGEDDTKLWFVLGGFMLIAVLAAATVVLLMYRSAMEARAASLALSAERSLISMRAARTIDGVAAGKQAGPDWLGQLIAGQPGSDIVDTGQHALAWPDDDKGDT